MKFNINVISMFDAVSSQFSLENQALSQLSIDLFKQMLCRFFVIHFQLCAQNIRWAVMITNTVHTNAEFWL